MSQQYYSQEENQQKQQYDGYYDPNQQAYGSGQEGNYGGGEAAYGDQAYWQEQDGQQQLSKQDYLREQIIDAGYDANQFAAYLQEQRPDVGIDADRYSYDELYTLVTNFQQMYQGGDYTAQNTEQPANGDQVHVIDEVNVHAQTVTTQHMGAQNTLTEADKFDKKDIADLQESFIQKGDFQMIRDKMEQKASSNAPRQIKLIETQANGMFSGKQCSAKVTNPQVLEEKVLFMSSTYLQFDLTVLGEISSLVQRKDNEFNDIQKYLSLKYPNVVVPPLDKNQVMKKFTDSYMRTRAADLARFMNYCLSSETLKADFLFEKFLDTSDSQEYKKFYTKFQKLAGDIFHLSEMPARLPEEKNGTEIVCPDQTRIADAQKTQKTFKKYLRVYQNANQRMYHNFKRLEADLRQVNQTVLMLRENIKTVQSMESAFQTELGIANENWQTALNQVDQIMSQINSNYQKQENSLKKFTSGLIRFRSQESELLTMKLDYATQFMDDAMKQDSKLKDRKVKLVDEKKLDKWENAVLLKSFSEDQIKKLHSTDKNACFQFILPKEQEQIDDRKMLSTYLTESLVDELERIKQTISYKDMISEVQKYQTEQKQHLTDQASICETMINTLN